MHSAAIHLLRRVRVADDQSMGMTPARRSALSVLVFAGPQSLSELAAAEQVTLPTMSKARGHDGEGWSLRCERDPETGGSCGCTRLPRHVAWPSTGARAG